MSCFELYSNQTHEVVADWKERLKLQMI